MVEIESCSVLLREQILEHGIILSNCPSATADREALLAARAAQQTFYLSLNFLIVEFV